MCKKKLEYKQTYKRVKTDIPVNPVRSQIMKDIWARRAGRGCAITKAMANDKSQFADRTPITYAFKTGEPPHKHCGDKNCN